MGQILSFIYGVVGGVVGIIGSLVKYSLYMGFGAVLIGIAISTTKPEDSTFDFYIKNLIKVEAQKNAPSPVAAVVASVVSGVVSKVALSFSSVTFRDFLVFKMVTCQLGGKTAYFVGTFNSWFNIN